MVRVFVLAAALGLPLAVSAQTVDLMSFGHPVHVVLSGGQLAWTLPAPSGDGTGTIGWKGDTPTNLRGLRAVVLPDSTDGVALIGSLNGRDVVLALQPTWEGAVLWSGSPWMTAPSGETIQDFQWLTSGDAMFLALWTNQSVAVHAGSLSQGFSDGAAALPTGTRSIVKAWPWSESADWGIAAVTLTSTGWVPSVWIWKNGLTAMPTNDPTTALPDAPSTLDVAPPQAGSFSMILHQASALASWSWGPWGSAGVQTLTLPVTPQGVSTELSGGPALFWWTQNGQISGQATSGLGTVAPTAWTLSLPGNLDWSSDVVTLTDRWRVWLVLETASGTGFYRLEVLPSGVAKLDRAGDLPTGTTAVDLRFDQGRWSVSTPDHTQSWRLDPDLILLTAVPSAPDSPLAVHP
jgi:hypothetical protein